MAETVVLVNPSAAGGRAGRRWEDAVRRAAAAQVSFREVRPGDRDEARREVAASLDRGVRRIVVWGGDGTAHLVVNEVVRAGAGADVVVGLVPAGTGCDLSRSLPIPRGRGRALRQALVGEPVAVDAGLCAGPSRFVFANIASAGISGLVDEKVNAVPDRGALAFLRATLAAFAAYRPVRAEIAVDGTPVFEGALVVAAVANGTTFGKGMRIAPRARVDDGLLDVVIVGGVSRAELALRLPQLYLGRHLGAGPVTAVRGRSVELRCGGPLPPFDADGETYPGGDAVFEVLPGAWQLAGPIAADGTVSGRPGRSRRRGSSTS